METVCHSCLSSVPQSPEFTLTCTLFLMRSQCGLEAKILFPLFQHGHLL